MRPVSRWSLTWRVLATLVLVVLLLNGSLRLEGQGLALGPMSQYAFSPPGTTPSRSPACTPTLADGERIEVPLRVETAAISRAEIEARIPDITRDPSLLRTVSDGWTARNPTRPRIDELFLVKDRTHLLRGRVQSTDQVTLADWRVTP